MIYGRDLIMESIMFRSSVVIWISHVTNNFEVD